MFSEKIILRLATVVCLLPTTVSAEWRTLKSTGGHEVRAEIVGVTIHGHLKLKLLEKTVQIDIHRLDKESQRLALLDVYAMTPPPPPAQEPQAHEPAAQEPQAQEPQAQEPENQQLSPEEKLRQAWLRVGNNLTKQIESCLVGTQKYVNGIEDSPLCQQSRCNEGISDNRQVPGERTRRLRQGRCGENLGISTRRSGITGHAEVPGSHWAHTQDVRLPRRRPEPAREQG